MYSGKPAFRCHVKYISLLKSLSCVANFQPFSLAWQIYQIPKNFVMCSENSTIFVAWQIYQIPKNFVMGSENSTNFC